MTIIKSAVAAAMALGLAAQVGANPITTLFNTGVDASGNLMANGTVGDPHYSLTSVAGGTAVTRVITSVGLFPVPPYIGDNLLSRWIGPDNDADLNSPPGNYTYTTTFDLTGLNPATASIMGRWSSDNDGVAILLNGLNTGNPATSFTQFSAGFANFTIGSGFVAGINTLKFVVHNGGSAVGNNSGGSNPTALRVEMTGNARVPDGGLTAMLLGVGLLGLSSVRRMVK
jgi:hypothetical protein